MTAHVSIPASEIAEQVTARRRALADKGWRPVAVRTNDKPPTEKDWPERARHNPPLDAVEPAKAYALNTGLLCDGVRAVDIDVDDPERAQEVKALALKDLGPAPYRWRLNSPRVLLLYRAAVGAPKKRVVVSEVYKNLPDKNGKQSFEKVEILGHGQQFVAYGGHDSGVALQWSPDGPDQHTPAELTEVTEEQVTAFLEEAAKIIAAPPPNAPRADAAPKAREAAHAVCGGAPAGAGGGIVFPDVLRDWPPHNAERDGAYIKATLDGEVAKFEATRSGRNDALNSAACTVGGLIRIGMDIQPIIDAFMSAADRNGYIAQDGRREAWTTLKSGLEGGMRKPSPDKLPSEREAPLQFGGDAEADAYFKATREAKAAGLPLPAAPWEAYRAQQVRAGVPTDAPAHSWQAQPAAPALGALTTVSALAGTRAKPRESYVRDVLVRRAVNLLYGDGATGKSLLGLHLGVAGALGAEWLGMPVERGPVLYLSAEDEIDEMHRRLERILARYPGRTLADLADLHIIDATAGEPTLAEPDAKGVLQPTRAFRELSAHVERLRPALLILDNAADVFGGDEIKKGQVRRFIAMLRKLAIECNFTVLLLAHPSQSGMSSGRGTSGNVAWSNSARSRLYFKRVTADGVEADPDLREMELMKANHAQIGRKWLVRYNDGAFDLETEIAAKTTDKQLDAAFLELLAIMEQTKRNVSPSTGTNYAPKIFSEMKLSDGRSYAKDQYRAAMERLLTSRTIEVDTIGPQSRQTKRLVIASPSLLGGGVQ